MVCGLYHPPPPPPPPPSLTLVVLVAPLVNYNARTLEYVVLIELLIDYDSSTFLINDTRSAGLEIQCSATVIQFIEAYLKVLRFYRLINDCVSSSIALGKKQEKRRRIGTGDPELSFPLDDPENLINLSPVFVLLNSSERRAFFFFLYSSTFFIS